jgi:hypothetical protein
MNLVIFRVIILTCLFRLCVTAVLVEYRLFKIDRILEFSQEVSQSVPKPSIDTLSPASILPPETGTEPLLPRGEQKMQSHFPQQQMEKTYERHLYFIQ